MKTRPDKAEAWVYDFAIESNSGEPICQVDAVELLDLVVEWAEARGFQVGGGFFPSERGKWGAPFG